MNSIVRIHYLIAFLAIPLPTLAATAVRLVVSNNPCIAERVSGTRSRDRAGHDDRRWHEGASWNASRRGRYLAPSSEGLNKQISPHLT